MTDPRANEPVPPDASAPSGPDRAAAAPAPTAPAAPSAGPGASDAPAPRAAPEASAASGLTATPAPVEPVASPAPATAGAPSASASSPDPALAPASAPAGGEDAVDEDDDPFVMVGVWVKAHPLFALLLMFITFGGPYIVWAWRARAERARLTNLQDTWQEALSSAGLPVPYAPAALVAAPRDVDLPGTALDGLGLGVRQRALVGWQTLLGGGQVPADQLSLPGALMSGATEPPGLDWLAAVRACALLREAAAVDSGAPAATLARARAEAERGPAPTRSVLRLAADLVEGRAAAVAAGSARLLQEGPHPAARGALVALRDEARRRRLDEVLRRPTPEGLRDVALFARDGADIVGPLAARGGALVEAATGLGAAAALVDLFDAAAPGGVATRPELAPAWEAVAPAIRGLVAERLRQFDDDPAPAYEVLDALARLDPAADAPVEGFLGWRDHLQRVVNDPARLRRLAERSFELGWTPAGLVDLLVSRVGPLDLAEGRLFDALLRTGRTLELPPDERARALPALELELTALDQALEARLGERADPIARRLRAQVAFLLGRARAAAGAAGAPGARDAFERARTLGFEPWPRLLAELAGVHEALGDLEAALAAARERVAALEELAPQLARGLSPRAAVALDLRGWPTDALSLGGERVAAHLDLARLLDRAGAADEALEVAAGAATLHPDHAAGAHLARAELLRVLGRRPEALAAARQALETVRPHEKALRGRIEALLRAIPD